VSRTLTQPFAPNTRRHVPGRRPPAWRLSRSATGPVGPAQRLCSLILRRAPVVLPVYDGHGSDSSACRSRQVGSPRRWNGPPAWCAADRFAGRLRGAVPQADQLQGVQRMLTFDKRHPGHPALPWGDRERYVGHAVLHAGRKDQRDCCGCHRKQSHETGGLAPAASRRPSKLSDQAPKRVVSSIWSPVPGFLVHDSSLLRRDNTVCVTCPCKRGTWHCVAQAKRLVCSRDAGTEAQATAAQR
jgi:hypothetical protein